MPEPALVHRVLQPGGQAPQESIAGVAVQVARFLRKLMRFGGQQLTGGDHGRIGQVAQVLFRESQQGFARRLGRGGQPCGGQLLVLGDHAAQQFLLAAEMRIQGLLGATGARRDRLHADAEALFGHEFAHGLVDTATTSIERGEGGGRAHADWTIPSSLEI